MKTFADKSSEEETGNHAGKNAVQLKDNRFKSVLQKKQVDALAAKNNSSIQKKENNTGLPDNLKSGIENLSGHSLDDVKVHYNSAQPAQLNAHAYAQGNQIHVAPGQEKHLPHEAWHVVQQKQGRVKPTKQLKGKTNINDDEDLEEEADKMGTLAQLHTADDPAQLKQQNFSPVLQGKFIDRTTLDEVQPEDIFAAVRDHVKYPEGDLLRAIEKLAEGPNLIFASLEELVHIVQTQLAENAGQLEADKDTDNAQWRKINRIAGLFQEKLNNLSFIPPQMAPFVRYLERSLQYMQDVLDINKVNLDLVQESLAFAIDVMDMFRQCLLKTGPRFMWEIYNIISEFGPYVHALQSVFTLNDEDRYAAGTPIDAYKDPILARLRDIRQLMARNPAGPTVVAHRGHGPTNRTMGGLIQDADQRRTQRPAENSPEAFRSAFASVPQAPEMERPSASSDDRRSMSLSSSAAAAAGSVAPPPSLDGVECDIYLSSDDVPMLSHEGNVMEQLSDAMKIRHAHLLAQHDEVHDKTAAELAAITRTASAASGFMTLEALLNMAAPVAQDYYLTTGKAFRIEVEMKGAKVAGKADTMKNAVARVISQFHKSNPSTPVEIILFNGDAAQVESYSDLRAQKTALGAMYTGINYKPGDKVDAGNVDELRAMFTAEFNIPEALGNFIVTLVFAQELVPAALHEILGNVEPDLPLLMRGRIERAPLSPKEMRSELAALIKLDELMRKVDPALLQKLHMLTDYPAKAVWLKHIENIREEITALITRIKRVEASSVEARPEHKGGRDDDKGGGAGGAGSRGGMGGGYDVRRGGSRGDSRGGGRSGGGDDRSKAAEKPKSGDSEKQHKQSARSFSGGGSKSGGFTRGNGRGNYRGSRGNGRGGRGGGRATAPVDPH